MKYLIFFLFLPALLFAKIENFKTIQSDFTQRVTNDQNKTITYEGQFYATQDKKALWIYEKPIAKKIYFNGNKVVILEPELEQAIITTLENIPNIALLLQEAKEISPNRYSTKYMETTYTINATNQTIERITYHDKLDNSVEISFSNQSTNLFLDDALFQVDIPKGYDIVRE